MQPKISVVQGANITEKLSMTNTQNVTELQPRMTRETLVSLARKAAVYLPTASAQLMNELATRLDVTSVALCESMEQRKQLKDSLSRMVSMHELMMDKVNHAASFYDGNCLAEMNEAPLQAKRTLIHTKSPSEGEM